MFDRQGGRKYLNDAERRAFCRTAKEDTDSITQAFCLTLFHTGCRISEALNLTSQRVDSSQKCIVFETLKRRRRGVFRAVPVPDELIALLVNQKTHDSEQRIWSFSRPTAYRIVKACMRRAGVAGGMASPKGLRHGFAVACVSKNIPLTTLQKWMGHARLETTAVYLNVTGNEERDLARRLWASK